MSRMVTTAICKLKAIGLGPLTRPWPFRWHFGNDVATKWQMAAGHARTLNMVQMNSYVKVQATLLS